MNNILIIDDDMDLCDLLRDYLSPEGFVVEAVHDGLKGVERAVSGQHTLVVLDVMLPGINGFEVLRQIRTVSHVPVLMLTARGEDVDRIVGLEIGADDYLPKPFNPRELTARIRAVLRRMESKPQPQADSGTLIAADTAARERARQEAGQAYEYSRYIINSSPDMIIAVDTSGVIAEFNKAAEEVFGYSKEEILGKHVDLLYDGSDESLRVSRSLQETGRFAGEIINKKKNHEIFPVFLSASIIKDAEGNPSGFMWVSRDITEHKKNEKELIAAATLDKLTGIFNRRKFESILDSEIDRTKRYKNPLSLILLDVDHFKKVNDTYGHQTGDYVLQTIAVIVNENTRKSDYFGRWGGEEFMILTPETAVREALELAEKIRRLIESYIFEKTGVITISCGITQFRNEDNQDSFIKRADDALYKAKKQGRNMVVIE